MEQIEQNLTKKIIPPAAEKGPKEGKKEETAKSKDYFAKIILRTETAKENFFPYFRKQYVAQGAEFLVDARDKGVQTMVFMDKSARPLAGFFRALWRRLWPEESPPEMKFMASTVTGVNYAAEDVARAFASARDAFDGKVVLLVDEIVSTGRTLNNAREKLKEAFPNANILLGAMAGKSYGYRLDITPPLLMERSTLSHSLGSLLYDKTDEVEKVRGWRGQSSKVIVRARRGHSPKETYSYILRQVGKYETLNEEYLDAINWKIADERNMDIDRKHRLLKIREAFEKLME